MQRRSTTGRCFTRCVTGLWVAMCSYALTLDALFARTNHEVTSTYHNFTEPPFVQEQLRFWHAVFGKFPSTSVLIHDTFHPGIVLDLLDKETFVQRLGESGAKSRRQREQLITQYMKRYQMGLNRFKSYRSAAAKMGAIEARIYQVYRQDALALKDLYQGRVNIRSQTGMADEFYKASQRATKYLPYMERVFTEYNLPVDLTRIAFVESMFNTNALSKVGASGIWQFMPATARQFMRVDQYIDERANPLKATHAAAKLLRDNYRILKSWPLAITAYNHGAGSMQRAIRKLNTNNFDIIARDYDAPSFGFASRNFYAEFLAVRNIYNSKYSSFTTNSRHPQLERIRLSNPVSISELIQKTPLTKASLLEYNKCLQPKAIAKYQYNPLPKNFELYVPKEMAQRVTLAINQTSRRSEGRFR